MHMTVLTLFPELINQVVTTSITGRALSAGLFSLEAIQIRDFAVNQYGKVDDYLFGGGTGMLMMAEPVFAAWEKAWQDRPADEKRKTVYLSPKGQVFNQAKARELAALDQLILLCGHYEGVDQRVLDCIVDEEISLGDYVLTGGELAACVVMDATARLLPGVLPNEAAYTQESHMQGHLEQPHYTRPANWRDQKVPDVLLSGHQAKIERWQYLQALRETRIKRPDLFNQLHLNEQDWRELVEMEQ
jgi:tRNA (guanine37-N1)-methyltransferase